VLLRTLTRDEGRGLAARTKRFVRQFWELINGINGETFLQWIKNRGWVTRACSTLGMMHYLRSPNRPDLPPRGWDEDYGQKLARAPSILR